MAFVVESTIKTFVVLLPSWVRLKTTSALMAYMSNSVVYRVRVIRRIRGVKTPALDVDSSAEYESDQPARRNVENALISIFCRFSPVYVTGLRDGKVDFH